MINAINGRYTMTPECVKLDGNLSRSVKLFFGELIALSSQNGYAYASNDYFANSYSVSKRTVIRWIKQLENEGYISVEFDNRKPFSSRKIFLTNKVFSSNLPMTKMSQDRDKSVIHNNIINNPNESKKEKKLNLLIGGDKTYPREGYEEVMNEMDVSQIVIERMWAFIASCRLNGYTITNDALVRQICELDVCYNDDIDKVNAINYAISRNYKFITRVDRN